MASQESNTNTIDGKPNRQIRSLHFALFILLAVCWPGTIGCQGLPGNQAMRQYQLESDRLLSELRAHKKRADDSEAEKSQLKMRLAESEKLVARLGGTLGRTTANNASKNRTDSKLLIGDARGDSGTVSSLSELASTRTPGRGPAKIQRGGLPDTFPSTSGQLTSGSRQDPISLGGSRDLRGDPKGESQWRPVNRGQ